MWKFRSSPSRWGVGRLNLNEKTTRKAMEFHDALSNWKARDFLNYPRKRGHFSKVEEKNRFEVLVGIHWDAYWFGNAGPYQLFLCHSWAFPNTPNTSDLGKLPWFDQNANKAWLSTVCQAPRDISRLPYLFFLSKVTLLLRFPSEVAHTLSPTIRVQWKM